MVFRKAETFSKWEGHIEKAMLLYDKLMKSYIIPALKKTFLGFQIDLVTFTLADDKKQVLKSLILPFLRIQRSSIRFLAKFIGIIISYMLALKLAPLLSSS